jgi:hypothetical protein
MPRTHCTTRACASANLGARLCLRVTPVGGEAPAHTGAALYIWYVSHAPRASMMACNGIATPYWSFADGLSLGADEEFLARAATISSTL